MRTVEIIRLEDNFKWGTFGVLKIDKSVFCVTLEPPDLLNKVSRSCIPAQQYECRKYHSDKFGSTFMVSNVPDRTVILFHAGNVVEHTEGCILTAEHFGKLGEKRAVLNSGNTFKMFMDELGNHSYFHLTIKESY